MPQLLDQCNYDATKASVDAFNAANRWRKRGIAIMPVKYCLALGAVHASSFVRVFQADGTVEVSTSE